MLKTTYIMNLLKDVLQQSHGQALEKLSQEITESSLLTLEEFLKSTMSMILQNGGSILLASQRKFNTLSRTTTFLQDFKVVISTDGVNFSIYVSKPVQLTKHRLEDTSNKNPGM